MKFQKGLLSDLEPTAAERDASHPPAAAEVPVDHSVPVLVEKDRLFETVKEETGSERRYIKVLGIIAVAVLLIAFAISYLTAPGIGDQVRAPKGLEEAVRDHFLTKEKRTATDITFYLCGDYYWARVDVEVRPDIKTNPIYQVPRYTARAATLDDASWSIIAAPLTSPDADVPCK